MPGHCAWRRNRSQERDTSPEPEPFKIFLAPISNYCYKRKMFIITGLIGVSLAVPSCHDDINIII